MLDNFVRLYNIQLFYFLSRFQNLRIESIYIQAIEAIASISITIIEFKSDEWCIGCGDPNKDILGKGVIVHQGKDDFTSQPSGAAGSRISCGGIIE